MDSDGSTRHRQLIPDLLRVLRPSDPIDKLCWPAASRAAAISPIERCDEKRGIRLPALATSADRPRNLVTACAQHDGRPDLASLDEEGLALAEGKRGHTQQSSHVRRIANPKGFETKV